VGRDRLADACAHDDTKVWAQLMTTAAALLDAATAAHRAANEGRARVPAATAARPRARYRHAIGVALVDVVGMLAGSAQDEPRPRQ